MVPTDIPEPLSTSGSSREPATRLAEHLARNDTSALTNILGAATLQLLGKLGPEATSPAGLAYFIVNIHGERGALRSPNIRSLLLAKLDNTEATALCQMLGLPVVSPGPTLRMIDFDATPGNLEALERWFSVANDDSDRPLQASEGSHKAVASHKLHAHQLNAFRDLRRAITTPCSVLVHLPFGAGKLRLVATAALDFYRSEADNRSIVWLATGTAMCEEAFLELQDVWKQLGSRDTTILRLYGDQPMRDLDQLGGSISVIDILRLSKDDPSLQKLGLVTSVAVFADAESRIHPIGVEIAQRMGAGEKFSLIGILSPSGDAIPEGPTRVALKAAFPSPCITVVGKDEVQSLRTAGYFSTVDASVVHFTSTASASTASNTPPDRVDDEPLDFDQAYADGLGNNVERNENLLDLLKKESLGKGRIVFYATTAENARLFAGLLPLQGVKARSVTAEESPAARALAIQKFVSREEKVLCVHGFLLSGSSVPKISLCVMAAPGKSRAAFLSTVGRLAHARDPDLPTLRLIVAADSQADTGWVTSLSTWSPLQP